MGPSPVLPDIRPPMKDVSAGGYSDPKEHLGGVCMGGLREREVSVRCPELSLGEISQSGCVRGPPYGNSVGLCVETPSEGTSVADCSAPYKRRAQGFSPSGFLLFCWCPFVSLLCIGVFGVSSPTLSTDLLMPLRTRQPPGSESLRGPPSLLSSGGHSVP